MSHYYAKILMSEWNTITTACGLKSTGIVTQAACGDGAIEVRLYHEDGKDYFKVERIPWAYMQKDLREPQRIQLLAKGEMEASE